jgi:hypothetical protein
VGMRRLALALPVALLVGMPSSAAAAPATYRDAEAGVEVRVARGIATVRFHEPTCGAGVLRARVRRGRLSRRTELACEPGGVTPARALRLSARVTPLRVSGHVEGRRFAAARNGARPTPAQLCRHRGLTRAETDMVRVYRHGRLTVACRRGDGAFGVIGRYDPDEGGYYASGISVWSIGAIGSRIAFAKARFDSAASKYGQGDDPMFRATVVVRDLATGSELRVGPEMVTVATVALHPDGRVAWAGYESGAAGSDVFVKTVRDGRVVTLDRGRIASESLRAEGDGFVWLHTQ